MTDRAAEIAAAAARLVVEEGMEYAAAKRRAARDHGTGRRAELPSNEDVEDAVREHLALFCADTQPEELRALRHVATTWMERLAPFRPHLAGAVWRGTATRLSAVHLDLYCDDPKGAEIELINQGVDYDVDGDADDPVLVVAAWPGAPGAHVLGKDPVTLQLVLRDLDDLRGALKPDARGRSWRGDLAALRRRMAEEDASGDAAGAGS